MVWEMVCFLRETGCFHLRCGMWLQAMFSLIFNGCFNNNLVDMARLSFQAWRGCTLYREAPPHLFHAHPSEKDLYINGRGWMIINAFIISCFITKRQKTSSSPYDSFEKYAFIWFTSPSGAHLNGRTSQISNGWWTKTDSETAWKKPSFLGEPTSL